MIKTTWKNMATSMKRLMSCSSYLRYSRRPMVRLLCTEALPTPPPDSQPAYPQKIHDIVDQISQLTLREASQLNDLLKTTLNISDVAMMPAGFNMPAAEEEEAEPKEVQVDFTVNLVKFDPATKVQLIKEIKGLMDGMNLVQAKKFVESVPQVLKSDISKEEAEKLKALIEAAGGGVTIE